MGWGIVALSLWLAHGCGEPRGGHDEPAPDDPVPPIDAPTAAPSQPTGAGEGDAAMPDEQPPRVGDADAGAGASDEVIEPQPVLIGDVAFSVPSQTFRDALDVSMSTLIEGGEIRYTTDGTLPTAASELYDGAPVTFIETTQLRAQVFIAGAPEGLVSTALYVARDFEFTSDLPVVIVDGYGAGKPNDKDVYFDAALMVFEPVDGVASIAALPTIATRSGYHVRGQSSSRFPKTPYRLELWDNHDEDADHALLGMPAQSDWALLSPYYDRTLIRNPFVYELGREMGLAAPRVTHVEVFLSYEGGILQESDYQGVYWLTETIKNARNRIDLAQLRETDTMLPAISGGYIFKFDQAAAEEPTLTCSGSEPLAGGFGFGGPPSGEGGTCWVDLEVIDPEPLSPQQQDWLTDYIQRFHDSLHTSPIGSYADFIDVASFVDYLIVNELTRNVDAYVRSAYFHKDRDGELHAGPLWDYNFSLALGGQSSGDPMGGFQYEGSRNVSNWYPRLTGDPAFMAQVASRWRELRQTLLSEGALRARVDDLAAPLAQAVEREYARWPVAEVYANPGIVRGSTAPDWETQLQVMRDFVVDRAAFIDTQW